MEEESMSAVSAKLFPPYLNQGSQGTPVNLLAGWMKSRGYDPADKIIFDGDYTRGGAIAAAVMAFQTDVGFKGEDVDGNFGPKTRAKWKDLTGIDVDALTVDMFAVPAVVARSE